MNGYQPKNRCDDCLIYGDCPYGVNGAEACKEYKECRPAPPKTLSNAQTPTYTPPPMPEVKPVKQRTVLSVRDFAILYHMVNHKILKMESQAQDVWSWGRDGGWTEEEVEKEKAKNMEHLRQNIEYQDLLRIREKLGELNIEIETPSVEVEDD